MMATEYKQIGKQLDIDKIREALNKTKKFTIDLTEGFPDDWKAMANNIAISLGRVAVRSFIHCFVFNSVDYECAKLVIVRVPASDTTRPFSSRSYGCIYHTSNEPSNGRYSAVEFKLCRPWTTREKEILWERNRTVVN